LVRPNSSISFSSVLREVITSLPLEFTTDFALLKLDATFVFDLDAGFSSRSRCRTTDVERTHRQLCTRLTDGLCRDNADSLTFVDDVTTRQITTVAVRTLPKSVSQDTTERTLTESTELLPAGHTIARQQRVARNQNVRFQYPASERLQQSHDPARDHAAAL
jgi:hypothetical protein